MHRVKTFYWNNWSSFTSVLRWPLFDLAFQTEHKMINCSLWAWNAAWHSGRYFFVHVTLLSHDWATRCSLPVNLKCRIWPPPDSNLVQQLRCAWGIRCLQLSNQLTQCLGFQTQEEMLQVILVESLSHEKLRIAWELGIAPGCNCSAKHKCSLFDSLSMFNEL